MGHLHIADLIVIGLYLLGVAAVGFWCARKQTSTEEYFVAGRRMPWFIIGLSIIASLISTVSYINTPGEMVKNGPGLMWGLLHVPFSFALVAWFIIPHIMKRRVTSVYELLEDHFGMRLRRMASLLFVMGKMTWAACIIYTCSGAVAEITDLNLAWVIAGVGLFGTMYTVVGGIRAVIITDVVQFVILVGGALLTLGYITWQCGGLTWWPDWSSTQLEGLDWKRTEFFSINPFERLTVTLAIFMNVVWWVTNGTSNQVIIQRYQCTSGARAARRSLLSGMICDSAVGLLLCLTGVALVGFFLQFPERLGDPITMIIDRPDDLFPRFIGKILPVGVSGLVIAAVFSAAMSSLDSGINSISTVLTVDFKSIVGRGCHTDRQLLTRAKLLGLAVGIVSIGLTYLIQFIPGRNLYEVLARAGIVMTPLPLLFFLAFFFPSSTRAGAWATIISGWVFAALFSYWQWIVGLFFDTGDFSIFLATPLALLCALIVGLLVSHLTRSEPMSEP